MLNQERYAGTNIAQRATDMMKLWADAPAEYKYLSPFQTPMAAIWGWTTGSCLQHKYLSPFQTPMAAAATEDSMVAYLPVDPRTQSFRWAGNELQETLRQQLLMQFMTQPAPAIGYEHGWDAYSGITREDEEYVYLIGNKEIGNSALARFVARSRSHPEVHNVPWFYSGLTPTSRPPSSEELEAARKQIETLQKTVDSLQGKVQSLEILLGECHQVLQSFSQSYYWTPEWQAKEARADEDAKLGRSQRYGSVEDLISDLNR